MTPLNDPRREALRVEGKRYLVRDHLALVIHVALLLAGARTWGWLNAWLVAALILCLKLSSALINLRINPAVLNARGTRREMSRRERVFFAVFIPSSLALPLVAGFDVGVSGWSHASTLELGLGLALLAVGGALDVWAIAVNAFFEPTVRIQRDREQRVCTAGPYRFVRHPGYVGAILATASLPLILGSRWCLVPAAIQALALVVRTAFEDRLLRDELEGYEDYASRTRYRLLPFVW